MDREQQQFQKRIRELAQTSWNESRFLFTGFLNEAEYADVLALNLPQGSMSADGGYEGASRVMVRFGDPEAFSYEEAFPIMVLKVAPLMEKYADALTHRDFLGAILNLGIERRVIGDILIDGATAYVMCEDHMADYLIQNLTRVKHTSVSTAGIDSLPGTVSPKLQSKDIQISSNRIDAVIAQVYHLSRSNAQDLLRSGQVFINGRMVDNSSLELAKDDQVSVRHMGKFRYMGSVRTTRKGKLCVRIAQYV